MQLTQEQRAKAIVRILLVCLAASTSISIIKMVYGHFYDSLAFFADGIHSMLDSASTVLGIISVLAAAKPPDKEHPYGHKKFEMVSAMALAFLLLLAGFEVAEAAWARVSQPGRLPIYSHWGLVILGVTMVINLGVAAMEGRAAKKYKSPFLASDSLHNRSDFIITLGVLVSQVSSRFNVAYVDAGVSLGIALYLAHLSLQVIRMNLKPLTDHRVLDPRSVESVVNKVDGVILCHNVRSRGEKGHHFLDLHIHLPGNISLDRAHDITHAVEARLQEAFPGLVDVVIHTEPHDHPPCKIGKL